jgi:hypothetical protein
MTRATTAAVLFGFAACIPDLGAALSGDGSVVGAAPIREDGQRVVDGRGHEHGRDGGESDAEAADAAVSAALCREAPPSQEVDRYVWGENFTFYFTPAGDEITALYVPRGALVHMRLAGSLNEEVHIFKITLEGCESPDIGLGTEGNESTYDWQAPQVAGRYPLAGKCVNHEGMEFDVVVTEP